MGITHFFNTDRRGSFDTISIADCHVAKVAHPEDIGYDMPRMPVVFVDWKLNIGSLIVSNLTREETQCAVEPTIAIYPETRIGRLTVRDIGCYLANFGGAAILVALFRKGIDLVWTIWFVVIITIFALCIGLRAIPFSPWVPSMQKLLIVSFAIWSGWIAWRMAKNDSGPTAEGLDG